MIPESLESLASGHRDLVRDSAKIWRSPREESEAGLDRAVAALARVVSFLRDSAGIPHSRLVPYELPVVVLARFFDAFPREAPRSRVLLRRWLWRASLCQRLSGASGSLQDHVDDIHPGDEHGSVQRLIDRSGRGDPPPSLPVFRPLSLGTALGKLETCALVGLKPRDLTTGERIDTGELFARGVERAVRKIVQLPIADGERLDRTLANRLVHPQITGLGPARLITATTDAAALASHAIDEDAVEALRRGDAAGFLVKRADRLANWRARFQGQRAEWGADDSPPIAALRHSA